jgi:8-oxo-dGTP pyrophosphatase MutT (NUDIX family)
MSINVKQRNRAAAVLRSKSMILLQRKREDPFWALPGGKIEPGEISRITIFRELEEELNWTPNNIRLICVAENSFTHQEILYQQVGFYYEADASSLAELLPYPSGVEFGVVENDLVFVWLDECSLSRFDIRPTSVLPLLETSPVAIVHFDN